jgi:hypothetical protein
VRLLVVEDVRLMANSIAGSLRREGLAVDVAYDDSTARAVGFCNARPSASLAAACPAFCGSNVYSGSTALGSDVP